MRNALQAIKFLQLLLSEMQRRILFRKLSFPLFREMKLIGNKTTIGHWKYIYSFGKFYALNISPVM
jgi:hypothetical protein